MVDRARSGWCGVLAALLAIAVGCSSGDDADHTTTSVAPTGPTTTVATAPATTAVGSMTTAPATPPTTAPVTAPATSSTPATSELSTADVAAITAAFETFFGGSTSTLDEKVAVLEDGETYRGMLSDASENAQFQQMSTDIRSIVEGSDTACTSLGAVAGCAIVSHDLLIGGMPMAAGLDSAAIRSADGWLVAAAAWCNIVAIGGDSCEAALDGTTP